MVMPVSLRKTSKTLAPLRIAVAKTVAVVKTGDTTIATGTSVARGSMCAAVTVLTVAATASAEAVARWADAAAAVVVVASTEEATTAAATEEAVAAVSDRPIGRKPLPSPTIDIPTGANSYSHCVYRDTDYDEGFEADDESWEDENPLCVKLRSGLKFKLKKSKPSFDQEQPQQPHQSLPTPSKTPQRQRKGLAVLHYQKPERK